MMHQRCTSMHSCHTQEPCRLCEPRGCPDYLCILIVRSSPLFSVEILCVSSCLFFHGWVGAVHGAALSLPSPAAVRPSIIAKSRSPVARHAFDSAFFCPPVGHFGPHRDKVVRTKRIRLKQPGVTFPRRKRHSLRISMLP